MASLPSSARQPVLAAVDTTFKLHKPPEGADAARKDPAPQQRTPTNVRYVMHSKVEARDGERCAMEHGPYYGGAGAQRASRPTYRGLLESPHALRTSCLK